jgi:hypothetical protein
LKWTEIAEIARVTLDRRDVRSVFATTIKRELESVAKLIYSVIATASGKYGPWVVWQRMSGKF